MNIISMQCKTYVCAVLMATMPVYGIQTKSVVVSENKNKNSVVWYKKRSTQLVAAAGAAAVVALYALAVYHNKMMGPIAAFAALFSSQENLSKVKNTPHVSNAEKPTNLPPVDPEIVKPNAKEIIISNEKNDKEDETENDQGKNPIAEAQPQNQLSVDSSQNDSQNDDPAPFYENKVSEDEENNKKPVNNETPSQKPENKVTLFGNIIQNIFGNNKTAFSLDFSENIRSMFLSHESHPLSYSDIEQPEYR